MAAKSTICENQRSTEKGIWYKTIQPKLPVYRWINLLSRMDLVMALRLRSGHIPSRKFGFLMKKVTSPNCEECGVVEDVQHVLMECVRNEALRFNLLGSTNQRYDIGECNAFLACPLSEQARILYKLAFSVLNLSAEKGKPKFIIDNDAGGDDAMAIFLALLYEKHFDGPKLLALTTGNGNTKEDNVCYNNQRILRVAKRQDVPIYRGSKASLVTTPSVTDYYGKDGLGDSGETFPDLVSAKTENAVNALIDYSKTYEGDLTVITIGTLTNIALAMKLDPGFLSRLNHLYIGAGHIHSEEHPTPEFNAHMDVEAYHVVAQNATPDKVTIFPFSQAKEYLNFTKEWREKDLGAIDTDIMKAQNKYEKVVLGVQPTWQALDPATVSLFLRPDLVAEYKYSKNDITVCGDKRGINTNDFVEKEKANVRIAYSVKTEEYKAFLLNVFGAELNPAEKSKSNV